MLEQALAAWEQLPPSVLSYHPGACCRLARRWLLAMDRSWCGTADEMVPPTWIRRRYDWGPAAWPLYWCQAVTLPRLDCGALAAMAREVLAARGYRVLPVQAAQHFPSHSCRQWANTWQRGGYAAEWTWGEHAYHELCGMASGGTLHLWDPTDNAWVHASARDEYGATVALRVFNSADAEPVLAWDGTLVTVGQWQIVLPGRERAAVHFDAAAADQSNAAPPRSVAAADSLLS